MITPEVRLHTALQSKPWTASSKVQPRAIYLDSLPSYENFFKDIFLKNQLCVIGPTATSEWASRKCWVSDDGSPNFTFLEENFGDALAPVADCSGEEFCSHPKTEMTVRDYLMYWQNRRSQNHPADMKCLYLKDWHFTKKFPSYCAYTAPAVLCSDWMNEFWDVREDGAGADDYRFVYMGPKGSWTPFHSDVLRSYSWSANICGQKKWIFYPPGEEEKLKDRHGQLVFDLQSPDLKDRKKYPQARDAMERAITVIQNPGEIIFVPSGWHHQVFNMEDTISINHNWMNGCSAHLTWEFVKKSLQEVQKEISDCREMDGWEAQCQMILKADSGMDYFDLYNFMSTIASNRLKPLQELVVRCQKLTQFSKTSAYGIDCSCGNHQMHCGEPAGSTDSSGSGEGVRNARSKNMSLQYPCDDENSQNKDSSSSSVNQTEKDNNLSGFQRREEHKDRSLCSGHTCGSQQMSKVMCENCGEKNLVSSVNIGKVIDENCEFLCLYKGVVVYCAGNVNEVCLCHSDKLGSIRDDKMIDMVKDRHDTNIPKGASSVNSEMLCNNHNSCPHWAHCGPNLALFDLHRVLDIVKDMQGQPDFKVIIEDEGYCDRLTILPSQLITEIENLISMYSC